MSNDIHKKKVLRDRLILIITVIQTINLNYFTGAPKGSKIYGMLQGHYRVLGES